jgi:translation elongation factor EF-Ts
MKNKIKLSEPVTAETQINELAAQMETGGEPTPADASRFREMVSATPSIWWRAVLGTQMIQNQLIKKMVKGATRVYLQTEIDVLKQRFGFDAAPALEQLLIEHILTARLRVIDAEGRYNSFVVNQFISFELGEYWEGILSAAHTRYIKATEALARVRRMGRNTPALQINIAGEGGKQVNVQKGCL